MTAPAAIRIDGVCRRFGDDAVLHDLGLEVDYKVHDLGQWYLNDQWPTPSFYS